MQKAEKRIKIKIEDHSYSKQDLESIIRWEGEGGSSSIGDLVSTIKLPVKKGQIFEVAEGEIVYENEQLFYRIKLNLLANY